MSKKNDIAEARGHLEELRRVVIDRYQLAEPHENATVAAIDAAIAAEADANVAGLRALIEGKNLYAHHAALAEAALYGVELAFAVEPAVEVPKVKPLERQNKAELIATAAAHGVEVPEGATVPQLREALAPVGFTAPVTFTESPGFDAGEGFEAELGQIVELGPEGARALSAEEATGVTFPEGPLEFDRP